MITALPTLRTLSQNQRITNVFADVPNIANYGGSEFLWNELLYRYGTFLVYSPETAKSAVERMFIINSWKYRTLLGTEIDVDPLTDFDITTEKAGTKKDTLTGNNTLIKSGGVTESANNTKTLDTSVEISENIEREKNTTVTENGENTLTLNTNVTEEETKTNNLTKTETEINNNYTDATNRSDYVSEDLTLKPVYSETLTHTQDSENPLTRTTLDTGTVQTESETINTGTESTDTTKTVRNTGTDTDTKNGTTTNTGTESTESDKTTTYNNLTDTETESKNNNGEYSESVSQVGYKSNPFELLDKARLTAMFSVIDVILKDTKELILYL